jgi:hypothetical protein
MASAKYGVLGEKDSLKASTINEGVKNRWKSDWLEATVSFKIEEKKHTVDS